MITLAWLFAIVWSLPQLYVWRTKDVFPDWPGGWIQCSDIWSIQRYLKHIYIYHQNDYSVFPDHNTTDIASINMTGMFDVNSDLTKTIYNLSHLVLVFFGPLIILIVCYAIIAVRLMQYSLKPTSHVIHPHAIVSISMIYLGKRNDAYFWIVQITQSATLDGIDESYCKLCPIKITLNSIAGSSY